MKTEEKESPENTASKPGKKRRSLKVLGMGIGAVGVTAAAVGQLSAYAVTDSLCSNRVEIQKAICRLAQNTLKLNEFLDKPGKVAGELGIRLTADQTRRIQQGVQGSGGNISQDKSKQIKQTPKLPKKDPLSPRGLAWVEPFDPSSQRGYPLKGR